MIEASLSIIDYVSVVVWVGLEKEKPLFALGLISLLFRRKCCNNAGV